MIIYAYKCSACGTINLLTAEQHERTGLYAPTNYHLSCPSAMASTAVPTWLPFAQWAAEASK